MYLVKMSGKMFVLLTLSPMATEVDGSFARANHHREHWARKCDSGFPVASGFQADLQPTIPLYVVGGR